jgi:lysine-N-methylase
MRLQSLPVVQQWDCQSCAHCCREYRILLTAADRQRLQAQGWESDPELRGQRVLRAAGPWWSRRYYLAQRRDQGCIFLTAAGRCRIHERFGAAAKPLACRLFPFVLIPTGNSWRVGLRYACPSAASNQGRPLAAHEAELHQLARLLEQEEGNALAQLPPPPLQTGEQLSWSELERFVRALRRLLEDKSDPLERRWRKMLALAAVCRQARFAKVRGGRLTEFLDLVVDSLETEVPAAADLPPPSRLGRLLFRQVLAVYARKDRGLLRGPDLRHVLGRFLSGLRLAWGRGRVPRLNAYLPPAVTFTDLEKPAGDLPADAQAVLQRYYQVKIASLQFCGPTGFGLSFWDGLEELALTFPAILWLARGLEAADRTQAVIRAVSIVDDHFGFNPVLRRWHHQAIRRLLVARGELPRLIAWYSR